jgi:hypothetical protein
VFKKAERVSKHQRLQQPSTEQKASDIMLLLCTVGKEEEEEEEEVCVFTNLIGSLK